MTLRSGAVGAALVAVLAFTAAVLLHLLTVVVTHGVSMQPSHHTGDLAIVRRTGTYAVGDVVAYRSELLHTVVLHRIVDRAGDRYVFKGDHNTWLDPERPTRKAFLGKEFLHIPRGGIWLHRLTAPPLLAAYAFLLLAGGGAAARTRRTRRNGHNRPEDLPTMSPRHRANPKGAVPGLPPQLRPVAATAAVLGVAGLALSGVAWTRPTQHVVSAASSTTSSMVFSYTAHVRPSAAYDGTTVTAPQPVFRKLTNSVDVTFAYQGAPGTLRVAAELATSSGWKTSIPISTARVGRTYSGRAHLDLPALQRRVDAAARATGLPAGEVSVAVVPQVSLAGGGTFSPRLELTMSDLVLKPIGDLTAEDAAKTTGTRTEPTRITALGKAISVRTARVAGPAALLLGLLVAAVLAALARLTGPVAEADRIRARYGQLVLPVHPIALKPGRPVVDVPDFASLARLAERYGLLVLNWSRGDVDTYVVQDEGTTYRYRSGRPADEPAVPTVTLEGSTS